MKQSLYNFSYTRENGEIVIYNTFSKAIAILLEEEVCALENIRPNSEMEMDISLLAAFKEQGFIVDDNFDELSFLKYFHYQAKFSNEQLHLTVAPTLDCNFACPYCYENARKGKMSQETQSQLLSYIEKKFRNGTKTLDITWYGGEPLLYPEIIDNLASNCRRLAERYSASVGMSLVTNGYLLTKEIIEMLERNKILSIQITLDGMAGNHNQRRYLRNGEGTFEKIVNNIKLFKDTTIRVNVRMNVDNINRDDYSALKELVDSIEGIEIGLYPAAVEKLNERKSERLQYYMSLDEYDDFILGNYTEENICDDGLDVIDNRRYFCAAELENSYVVDERGNFYKCWDEIGREDGICFNVSKPDEISHIPVIRYVMDDPFTDSKCCSCKFLPLCFGGCRFQKNIIRKSVCNFTDETIKTFIETKYLSEQIK